MVSQKISKVVTPAKLVLDLIGERESPYVAGLIFPDSRFHGNDNNGCFVTFYEFNNFGYWIIVVHKGFINPIQPCLTSRSPFVMRLDTALANIALRPLKNAPF